MSDHECNHEYDDPMDQMLDEFGKELYNMALEENPHIVEKAEEVLDSLTEDQRVALRMVATCSKIALKENDVGFLIPAVECLAITGFFGHEDSEHDTVSQRATAYTAELWEILQSSVERAEGRLVEGVETLLQEG